MTLNARSAGGPALQLTWPNGRFGEWNTGTRGRMARPPRSSEEYERRRAETGEGGSSDADTQPEDVESPNADDDREG